MVTLLSPNLHYQVLKIIEKCSHVNHLKQLQSFLTTYGHSQNQFYVFKLVRFCHLKLSNFTYARRIFDDLVSPDIYLYTAMITAYSSQMDSHYKALSLYREMVRRGSPQPNHFIYPHVLKSCFEVSGTKMVHAQIVKSGFVEYSVVQTALVDSYSSSNQDVGSARKVFDEMSERTVVSWTAMVSGYTRAGDVKNAVSLFEEMPDRDVPSWNSVIAGFTQNGLFSEAISFFRRMVVERERSVDIRPNEVTVVCVLSACGHTGMLEIGRLIHGYVYRNGLVPYLFVWNALLDMYGKCGSLKEARRIFDWCSKKNLTSWNSVINCFALHGRSETAICLFQEMMQSENYHGIRPDEVTFIGVLNACTHGGLVEKGLEYFDLMTRHYQIEPRISHYGCLIDLLGRAGRFEKAMGVIREMKMEPDEVVWGSLLNGCRIHGRSDLAEFAVYKLFEIDPNNGGYGTMLANLYGESGKWDEATKVRKMMKDRNAYKVAGCSWIEIDKQVNLFYSVDKTHPRTEEIYDTLEILISHLFQLTES